MIGERFKGKKILVIGLAKSGEAAAKLLHRHGAEVTVNDRLPYEENEQAKNLEQLGIRVVCGGHPLQLLDENYSLIIKNPGIPYSNPLIEKAQSLRIPIVTEIELCPQLTEADIIAISGSNGKTTTTTLIYEMLQNSEKTPKIAGNIGTVACEVAEKATKDDVIVLELSSFQLLGTEEFRSKISVLLNIFDAHLDYHRSKDEYIFAKANITANQTEDDYFVYNADDPLVAKIAKQTKAKLLPFSTKSHLEDGLFIESKKIYFKEEEIIALEDIVLPGVHNYENILAAIGAALLAGANMTQVNDVLRTFTGVRHRLQFVMNKNGRRFYNDSKATNMLATEKALQSFERNIVWLAGGLDRGDCFDELIPMMKNVRAVVTFGETKEKIAKSASKAGIEMVMQANMIEDAVTLAYECSSEGDIILLSPACASWDQYKTFEERGDRFIEAVQLL